MRNVPIFLSPFFPTVGGGPAEALSAGIKRTAGSHPKEKVSAGLPRTLANAGKSNTHLPVNRLAGSVKISPSYFK